MREWLLLGVIALGGILGIWLLIFKSLAALYELWMSGREFERLKRDAASRRMQRPSELMQRKKAPVEDDDSDMPVIPQSILDTLSDEEADPRLVPQKEGNVSPATPQVQDVPDDTLASETQPEQPPAPTPAPEQDSSTTTTPGYPAFPLPPAPADDSSSEPPDDSSSPQVTDDASERPPRYDG